MEHQNCVVFRISSTTGQASTSSFIMNFAFSLSPHWQYPSRSCCWTVTRGSFYIAHHDDQKQVCVQTSGLFDRQKNDTVTRVVLGDLWKPVTICACWFVLETHHKNRNGWGTPHLLETSLGGVYPAVCSVETIRAVFRSVHIPLRSATSVNLTRISRELEFPPIVLGKDPLALNCFAPSRTSETML